ncbi:fimbrial protein [Lelliottia amnigena]|uniref:Fimbrial protein n=1 Tax=Lelliottia amnigena TaxID=61646 RepID=A0ABU7U6G4_LELAM
MNKTLLSLTLASLLMAGAVQAEDRSATVDISGTVIADNTECTVNTSTSSVVMTGKIADLINQGENATSPNNLNFTIGSSDAASTCIGLVALQLHGVADDADGTALANSETGVTAAKGVGIGLFDNNSQPLAINNNQIVPTNDVSNNTINLQMVKLTGQTPVEGTVHASLTIDIVRL